jgi:hypothetical protein
MSQRYETEADKCRKTTLLKCYEDPYRQESAERR